MKLKIKTKFITLKQLPQLVTDEDNNLALESEKVSVVYYRSGYTAKEYEGDWDAIWKAREAIELSTAISIPDATMKLINSKRMQAELSKEEVYKEYLDKEETELIRVSLAKQWDFDNVSEKQF